MPNAHAAVEGDLVARLRAGDEFAFEELVRETGGHLLAVARRLLRHDEDARDAVQETYLKAFRAIDRFREGSRLSTWLHSIVVNAALMKLRRRRVRNAEAPMNDLLPQFTADDRHADRPRRWSGSVDSIVQSKEARRAVRAAIDRLPDPYRSVLLLRDIEGLDTRSAANALGLTEQATKTRLHRARQALRSLLDPVFGEG